MLVTIAFAEVQLNQHHQLTVQLGYLGSGYLLALIVAHVTIRRIASFADPLLLPLVALLNGLGLVMIYRLDLAVAAKVAAANELRPVPQAAAQLMWTGVALLFSLIVLWVTATTGCWRTTTTRCCCWVCSF